MKSVLRNVLSLCPFFKLLRVIFLIQPYPQQLSFLSGSLNFFLSDPRLPYFSNLILVYFSSSSFQYPNCILFYFRRVKTTLVYYFFLPRYLGLSYFRYNLIPHSFLSIVWSLFQPFRFISSFTLSFHFCFGQTFFLLLAISSRSISFNNKGFIAPLRLFKPA